MDQLPHAVVALATAAISLIACTLRRWCSRETAPEQRSSAATRPPATRRRVRSVFTPRQELLVDSEQAREHLERRFATDSPSLGPGQLAMITEVSR
jgi:hypothetical protein